jgi:hypothetical protein
LLRLTPPSRRKSRLRLKGYGVRPALDGRTPLTGIQMNLSALTMKALAEQTDRQLSGYGQALSLACDKTSPLFGKERYAKLYREAAVDPQWMTVSLISNAEREGDGAGRLWTLAACTEEPVVSEKIKQHAIDESRHARAYLAMLDLVFPGAADGDFRRQLNTLSPGYGQKDHPAPVQGSPFAHPVTLDELIQMNIAEIRTRVHHIFQRPLILAHCPKKMRARLTKILDSLLFDETRHILYTAELIEQYWKQNASDEVNRLMCDRMADFNEVTARELGDFVFS